MTVTSINRGKLAQFYQRWFAIEIEADKLGDCSKELFSDARSFGFDGKPLRAAFNLKRKYESDPTATEDQKAEVEALLEALGVTAQLVTTARSARECDTGDSDDPRIDPGHELTIRERGRRIMAWSALKAAGLVTDAEFPEYLANPKKAAS